MPEQHAGSSNPNQRARRTERYSQPQPETTAKQPTSKPKATQSARNMNSLPSQQMGISANTPNAWQQPYPNQSYPPQRRTAAYEDRHSFSQNYPVIAAQNMNYSGRIPPVPPVPPTQPQQPPKEHKPLPDWTKKAIFAAAAVVAVIVLIALINSTNRQKQYNALVQEVEAYNDRFCNGVYVDGIHLGGMTQMEAWDAVSAQAAENLTSWSVQVTFEGSVITTLNATVLGLSVDPTDALTEASQQGHTGTDPTELKAAREELEANPFYAYSVESDVDLSVLDTMMEGLNEQLYIAPQDASIARFDADLSYPFVFNEEVVGRELDLESLKSQLVDMFQTRTSGTVELQVGYVQPEITVEYLKKYVVCELSTVYTDISTRSTDNRNSNIRQALSKVNGTVVKPGETFSFNDAAGDRTLANGYYEAPEYVYSQEVMGVGGGVCQASTTVYQAAIYAGMTIVDRSPHSLEVNYSDFGKDATVNSTKGHRVDLKFKNNTEYPIYIKSAVESKDGNRSRLVTRVTIYGPYKGDGVTYDFAIEEEVLPAPEEAQIVVDKDSEYVYYETEEYEYQKAKDGVKVTSYQVKYVNGV